MKIKLLTIGHSYVVSLNRSLMRELNAQGNIEVTVLAPEYFHGDLRSLSMEPEPQASFLKVRSIKCYFSKKIHFFFYDPLELKKILQEEDFDYFYLWEEPYVVSGYQVARELQRLKKPYAIFSAQNILKKYPWPFSHFEKFALEHSQAVWPCGNLVLECLNKKGFGHLKADVVSLPVDLKHFHKATKENKLKEKERLGLKQKKIIGFMGRLTPEKGVGFFLKALEELLKNPDYGGLLIGSGPLEPEIQAWIKSHRFESKVKLVSALHSEVSRVLSVMDVILCPSQSTPFWEEQFGRMIIEAFACGIPVIGSRSGEIPYVVSEAGLLVDPQDTAGWIKSAKTVLEDEIFSQELIQKGLIRAQKYSAMNLALELEKNILDAVGNIK